MFFDLLSTRLSTFEAQKRLCNKQPQAELKKGCTYRQKKTCISHFQINNSANLISSLLNLKCSLVLTNDYITYTLSLIHI